MVDKKKPVKIVVGIGAVVLALAVALWCISVFATFPYTLAIGNHGDFDIEIRYLAVKGYVDINTKIRLEAEPDSVANNKFPFVMAWEATKKKKLLILAVYETATGQEKIFTRILEDAEGVGGAYKLVYQNGELSEIGFTSFKY